MKKSIKALTIIPVIVLLAGCGINAGTVSSKVVEEERRYPVKVGKVWTTRHDDADYCFTVTDNEGSTGYVCVEKSEWDTINEGDYYSKK